MGGFVPLGLKTGSGSPLPHTFFEGEGAGLLVVLPGLHYGPDGPALYLTAKQLQQAGWDSLSLTYGFQMALESPWSERFPEILDEVRSALETVAGRRTYSMIGVAGKSLGSMVLAQLCSDGTLPPDWRVAHLTPPVGNPIFDATFVATRQPAYVAIGTADSFYEEGKVRALLERRPAWIRILDRADHGLDVADDLAATLQVLGMVVRDTAAFFRTGAVPGLPPPAP